jgi:hypothetical protein
MVDLPFLSILWRREKLTRKPGRRYLIAVSDLCVVKNSKNVFLQLDEGTD